MANVMSVASLCLHLNDHYPNDSLLRIHMVTVFTTYFVNTTGSSIVIAE